MKFTKKRVEAMSAIARKLQDKIADVANVYDEVYGTSKCYRGGWLNDYTLNDDFIRVDYTLDDYDSWGEAYLDIQYDWLLIESKDELKKAIEDFKWEDERVERERKEALAIERQKEAERLASEKRQKLIDDFWNGI
jgi:hypothetical protein